MWIFHAAIILMVTERISTGHSQSQKRKSECEYAQEHICKPNVAIIVLGEDSNTYSDSLCPKHPKTPKWLSQNFPCLLGSLLNPGSGDSNQSAKNQLNRYGHNLSPIQNIITVIQQNDESHARKGTYSLLTKILSAVMSESSLHPCSNSHKSGNKPKPELDDLTASMCDSEYCSDKNTQLNTKDEDIFTEEDCDDCFPGNSISLPTDSDNEEAILPLNEIKSNTEINQPPLSVDYMKILADAIKLIHHVYPLGDGHIRPDVSDNIKNVVSHGGNCDDCALEKVDASQLAVNNSSETMPDVSDGTEDFVSNWGGKFIELINIFKTTDPGNKAQGNNDKLLLEDGDHKTESNKSCEDCPIEKVSDSPKTIDNLPYNTTDNAIQTEESASKWGESFELLIDLLKSTISESETRVINDDITSGHSPESDQSCGDCSSEKANNSHVTTDDSSDITGDFVNQTELSASNWGNILELLGLIKSTIQESETPIFNDDITANDSCGDCVNGKVTNSKLITDDASEIAIDEATFKNESQNPWGPLFKIRDTKETLAPEAKTPTIHDNIGIESEERCENCSIASDSKVAIDYLPEITTEVATQNEETVSYLWKFIEIIDTIKTIVPRNKISKNHHKPEPTPEKVAENLPEVITDEFIQIPEIDNKCVKLNDVIKIIKTIAPETKNIDVLQLENKLNKQSTKSEICEDCLTDSFPESEVTTDKSQTQIDQPASNWENFFELMNIFGTEEPDDRQPSINGAFIPSPKKIDKPESGDSCEHCSTTEEVTIQTQETSNIWDSIFDLINIIKGTDDVKHNISIPVELLTESEICENCSTDNPQQFTDSTPLINTGDPIGSEQPESGWGILTALIDSLKTSYYNNEETTKPSCEEYDEQNVQKYEMYPKLEYKPAPLYSEQFSSEWDGNTAAQPQDELPSSFNNDNLAGCADTTSPSEKDVSDMEHEQDSLPTLEYPQFPDIDSWNAFQIVSKIIHGEEVSIEKFPKLCAYLRLLLSKGKYFEDCDGNEYTTRKNEEGTYEEAKGTDKEEGSEQEYVSSIETSSPCPVIPSTEAQHKQNSLTTGPKLTTKIDEDIGEKEELAGSVTKKLSRPPKRTSSTSVSAGASASSEESKHKPNIQNQYVHPALKSTLSPSEVDDSSSEDTEEAGEEETVNIQASQTYASFPSESSIFPRLTTSPSEMN